MNKTEWACPRVVFLGILLDGVSHVLRIPEDKRTKALNWVRWLQAKKRATVRELQQLAGMLNFLHRAIYPGRAFTRRMYAKFAHIMDSTGKLVAATRMRYYHHVRLDREFIQDCNMWELFLSDSGVPSICRPFIDLKALHFAQELCFTSDSAAGITLGYGGVFNKRWFFGKWPENFINSCRPSIEFLELYALVVAVYVWSDELQNSRSVIFCDNKSVVGMVQKSASGCQNCAHLIRLLVLRCLTYNMRIFCKHIPGKDNKFSDLLSRQNIRRFKRLAPDMEVEPESLPKQLCPVMKVWNVFKKS